MLELMIVARDRRGFQSMRLPWHQAPTRRQLSELAAMMRRTSQLAIEPRCTAWSSISSNESYASRPTRASRRAATSQGADSGGSEARSRRDKQRLEGRRDAADR